MTLSLRRKRQITQQKPRTGDDAPRARRRRLSTACLPAMLAMLLTTPTRADEPAGSSKDASAVKTVNLWKAKRAVRPVAANTLKEASSNKDTSSKLKWRPYRKGQPSSGVAHRGPKATSPAPSRLVPLRPVRLIAADPSRDRFALQPPPRANKPNEIQLPPPEIARPSSDVPSPPKLDSKDGPLPPPPAELFGKDDVPKQPTPDTTPKDAPPPQDAAEDDGSEKKTNYRLSRIGELSIDISPAAKPYTWSLWVDEEGGLRLKVKGVDDDKPSLEALLIGVFKGQVMLREVNSPQESGDENAGTAAEGKLYTYPLEKLNDNDRKEITSRIEQDGGNRLDKKTWTHRGGKHDVAAVFVRLRGWIVDLETDDGKIVSVQLNDLALDDQKRVLNIWGLPTTHQQPQVEFASRNWAPIDYTWTASALCHNPLYFEQVQVERYGHSLGPYLQPIASAAHFFLTVPALPYMMGVDPPNECVYALGYYRPGSCAPYMIPPLPISLRGAVYQGGIVTGLAFLLP
ncbi:MAG: hypothetical protein IID44_27830 [Planctomycetes bacterium]|nr:hypothetical protein [Planctomycetota bacterium]